MRLTKSEKILIYDLVRIDLKTWETLTKKNEWDLKYIKELKSIKKKLAKDLFPDLELESQIQLEEILAF